MAPIAMAIPIAASGDKDANAGHADFHADARADDHRRTFVTNAAAVKAAMPARATAATGVGGSADGKNSSYRQGNREDFSHKDHHA